MFTTYLVLGFFLFTHEAWGAPQLASVSTGAQLSADFNKNLALMMNNIQSGASQVASKPVTMTFTTIPNLFKLGATTAEDKLKKISSASNDTLSKVVVAGGNAIGAGGVLASSVAGGKMKVAGSGMGLVNDVVEAGVTGGINILGKVGDKTAAGIEIGGNLGQSTLTAVADGIKVTTTGTDVLAAGIAQLIASVGQKTVQNMKQAEMALEKMMDKGASFMGNGVQNMSSNMLMGYYNSLKHLLEMIINAQKMFADLQAMIEASATISVGTAGVEGAAGAGSGAAGVTGAAGAGNNAAGVAGAGAGAAGANGAASGQKTAGAASGQKTAGAASGQKTAGGTSTKSLE